MKNILTYLREHNESVEICNVFGKINFIPEREMILDAFAVSVEKLNHDPFRGHRASDKDSGSKSTFMYIENHEESPEVYVVKEIPDENTIILMVYCNEPTGQTSMTCGTHGKFEVAEVHGCLQLKSIEGDYHAERGTTNAFTIILTKEKIGDRYEWALATAFPGEPGSNVGKYLAENGYKVGDIIEDKDIPSEYLEHVNV